MQIFVKLLAGKVITLDVQTTDTVLDLKKKIAAVEKIGIDKLKLIFSGNTLENDKKLNEYDIEEESTVYAITAVQYSKICTSKADATAVSVMIPAKDPSDVIQITIRSGSGTFIINTKGTEKISDLRKVILDKCHMSRDSTLIFHGAIQLLDGSTVASAGIKNLDIMSVGTIGQAGQ